MTLWLVSAAVLVALLVPLAAVAAFGTPDDGLVALELASVLVTVALLLMAVGIGRQILGDLALVLAVASSRVRWPTRCCWSASRERRADGGRRRRVGLLVPGRAPDAGSARPPALRVRRLARAPCWWLPRVLVRDGASLIGVKAVLVGAFLVATAPVLGHATARAIYTRSRGRR